MSVHEHSEPLHNMSESNATVPNLSGSKSTLPYAVYQALNAHWLYKFWMVYVIPFIVVIGTFNNTANILMFLRGNVQIGTRFKVYYTILAIFDLLAVMAIDLIAYLDYGLAITTNGNFFIFTRTSSALGCKVNAAAG